MSNDSTPSTVRSSVGAGRPRESVESLQTVVQELEQQLVECQRLALLGNLAAMAAHEFRNIMTAIIPLSEEGLRTDDRVLLRKAADRALKQAKRALNMTDRLLGFAREEHGPVESCSVAECVEEAIVTSVRPFEKDGITLTVTVPDELRVTAHADLFCQVLVNLLLNARQAMKGQRGPLSIKATRDGDSVEISVCDSGEGFNSETLERVLNPFLAADPLERLTDWRQVGLGLSVCRMIVRRQGATLHATANKGTGCTFYLRWPAA
jgi:signal transduction histidine kinase